MIVRDYVWHIFLLTWRIWNSRLYFRLPWSPFIPSVTQESRISYTCLLSLDRPASVETLPPTRVGLVMLVSREENKSSAFASKSFKKLLWWVPSLVCSSTKAMACPDLSHLLVCFTPPVTSNQTSLVKKTRPHFAFNPMTQCLCQQPWQSHARNLYKNLENELLQSWRVFLLASDWRCQETQGWEQVFCQWTMDVLWEGIQTEFLTGNSWVAQGKIIWRKIKVWKILESRMLSGVARRRGRWVVSKLWWKWKKIIMKNRAQWGRQKEGEVLILNCVWQIVAVTKICLFCSDF